jgi:RNA polymerase sigma-70 factor, ECF subfamily
VGHVQAISIEDRRDEFRALFLDEERFRAWYDVAARRLYRYLYGRCGGDAALAEELTQQSFLHAVRSRDTYDGRSDPITWLVAIGRNQLVDHVRNQEREERRHLRLVVREIRPSDGDDRRSPDEREAVLAALRGLPASQRAALVLHHVDGLPVREIARALGRSEGAVEQLLNRGRARFRELYEEADRG